LSLAVFPEIDAGCFSSDIVYAQIGAFGCLY